MKNNIKVLQIIPNLDLGGAEIMVENLSVALQECGINLYIISLYDFHSAITERLESKNIPILFLGKKIGPDFKIVINLYKILKAKKPDIVHTHLYSLPYVIPAAILTKVPVKVHTVHNIADKELPKLGRKINDFIYKYFRVVPVAISPKVKESIINEYSLNINQVPVIRNGINLDKCIIKKEHCASKNELKILHIGRFSEQKNHMGLLESFKIVHDKMPHITLKLIGKGELEKAIKSKVEELGLVNCVEFLGSQSDVYPYLSESDIFVLPSLWEGMPITLIEAMATGLPIVASKVGGIPDMIDSEKNGLLVDPEPFQIAEAIMRLACSEEMRRQLGVAAVESAKLFSAKVMAEEYCKIYNK